MAAFRANLQQNRRQFRSRVEEQTGKDDTVCVRSRHGRRAVDGTERGEAEAEDYGAGMGNAERFGQVVDSRRQQQVLAGIKLGVDGGGSVRFRVSDVELVERNVVPGG